MTATQLDQADSFDLWNVDKTSGIDPRGRGLDLKRHNILVAQQDERQNGIPGWGDPRVPKGLFIFRRGPLPLTIDSTNVSLAAP